MDLRPIAKVQLVHQHLLSGVTILEASVVAVETNSGVTILEASASLEATCCSASRQAFFLQLCFSSVSLQLGSFLLW